MERTKQARWMPDPSPTSVSPGVVRMRDPRAEGSSTSSITFVSGLTPTDAVSTGPAEWAAGRAQFAVVDGRHAARFEIEPGTSLYGTGAVAGPLLRNGWRVVCWNTDPFEYDDRAESLYQSHPWVLALRADGSALGVLADTTWRCEIDLTDGIEFRSHGPAFDVYAVEAGDAGEVLRMLADLTGHAPLPPRWALGYHQCRWSYEPASRVREIAREFRARRIPCDVIWLDIDYMDGFACFTFDDEKFPDPAALNADLHAQGFKTVWMIDPGIKVDEDYAVYAAGREGNHFVRTAGGAEYHGKVWPGPCAFPDFTRSETRAWWADLHGDFIATGLDGVWNDMNEPSIFDTPGNTMDEDCVHRADEDLGGPGEHARYHNIYGLQMVRATREGIARARPERRPFVLTRSSFVGGQRYAWMWTGDNVSDWTHLRWSISMILNLGLSGQPFAGADIGGFSGDVTGQLFGRWMGIGSLMPFARGHAEKSSCDKEPWALGETCERVCRRALERRYRLLPYLYTLAWEACETGVPMVRPVWFADSTDASLRDVDDCFLLGEHLLVRCRVKPMGKCESPMPRGRWRRFEPIDPAGASTLADEELPEVFIRGGAMVPLGPIMQYTHERPTDPLTLVVHLDETGHASGVLYEDAGDGFGHERGQYLLSRYEARLDGDTVRVSLRVEEGLTARPERGLEVVVMSDVPGCAHGRDGATVRVALG